MIHAESKTVADMVAENPARAAVFEKHGIDFCCQGQRPFGEVCKEQGLSPDTLWDELNASPPPAGTTDWNAASLTDLVEHIVARHHAYLRSAFPSVEEKLGKLIKVHTDTHGDMLLRLENVIRGLEAELTDHMMKEETILFPLITQIEAARQEGKPAPWAPGGSINHPIRMMEQEHDSAGNALKSLKAITSGYAPPPDACATFEALYRQLQELEADLHVHIHLENHVLFPRAASIEAELQAQ